MNRRAPLFNCPRCGNVYMSVIQKDDNNKRIEYECTGCLSWWVLEHHEMSEDDIREVAQCV